MRSRCALLIMISLFDQAWYQGVLLEPEIETNNPEQNMPFMAANATNIDPLPGIPCMTQSALCLKRDGFDSVKGVLTFGWLLDVCVDQQ